jgi:cytochrome P450
VQILDALCNDGAVSSPTEQQATIETLRSTWETGPIFEQLRAQAPVLYVPELDAWILSRYEDVHTVARDTKRFGAMPADLAGEVPAELADELPDGYAPWQPALVNLDPPEHTRIRKLAQKPLTAKAVALREEEIRQSAHKLIDVCAADGRADMVSAYATQMPQQALNMFLGIPTEDQERFREWTLGINELMVPTIPDERRLERAREQVDFNDYITAVISARREEPTDDLISSLIQAQEENERSLSDREILGVVGQLIIAGIESSAGGISYSLYTLCDHPETRDRAAQDLTLIPAIVEEALRRLAPARGIIRRTKEDVEFDGQRIPKGSNIFALVQSANNDPAQFECPERFDIDRPESEMRKSLHWGIGPHRCIGMPLARLDIQIALEVAITRLANLRPVPDQEITVQPGMFFHRPMRLEFEWDI